MVFKNRLSLINLTARLTVTYLMVLNIGIIYDIYYIINLYEVCINVK